MKEWAGRKKKSHHRYDALVEQGLHRSKSESTSDGGQKPP